MAKKLNGVSSTLTIIFAIFLIACSDSPSNAANNGDDKIDSVITANLPELPEAIGGILSEEKYADMPNREVTQENLHEFLAMFRAAKDFSALTEEDGKSGSSKRSRKEIMMRERGQRTMSNNSESGSFVIPDGHGGSMIWDWTYKLTEGGGNDFYELTVIGTERFQAYDYSQSVNLFFGEVLSLSFYEYWYESESGGWREIFAKTATGNIEFRGEFAGSIEYTAPYYRETWGSSNFYERRNEGEIIIISGANRIPLPLDDWWEFLALL